MQLDCQLLILLQRYLKQLVHVSTRDSSATLLVSGLSSLTNITATNQTVSNLLATSAIHLQVY
jgi:hypothetical protein